MPPKFAEQQSMLRKLQLENKHLEEQLSKDYNLLLAAFWQKYSPLVEVETLTFTPHELQAWIDEKSAQRRPE